MTHTKTIEPIVQQILTGVLPLQQAVALVLDDHSQHELNLRQLMTDHKEDIVRLWATWCLAELRDQASVPLIKTAYLQERHAETRVNMVWALFMIDPKTVTLDWYRRFLNDEHFTVPMLCIRYIHGLCWLEGNIDFTTLYQRSNHELVRIELLKNIRSFRYDTETINNFLEVELQKAADTDFAAQIICAIAYTNQLTSADVLVRYYHKNRETILRDESLAYHLTNAARYLARAKLFKTLEALYHHHQSPLVRMRVKEALLGGGSCCFDILERIVPHTADNSRTVATQPNVLPSLA